MEILINIDGVLRNLIQKFEYHYKEELLMYEDENNTKRYLIDNDDEVTEEEVLDKSEPFEYELSYPIRYDNLLKSFRFQDVEEYENFKYIEFPLEIYGHAGLSYSTAISDFNKLIYNNSEHNFTVVGFDELGKAKPSTLFFLSKSGFLGNNIKFINTDDIKETWKKYDVWVTNNVDVVTNKPRNKRCIFFDTEYTTDLKIRKKIERVNDLKDIKI